MQITIEDNKLIYIYLKSQSKFENNIGGNFSVKCFLLYDDKSNWIGLQIQNEYSDGEKFRLPFVGNIDYPLFSANITESNENITILFDKTKAIHRLAEQDCNIVLNVEGIYGIELILWLKNDLGKKDIVKPFVLRDI
jgi:hypothetical protein